MAPMRGAEVKVGLAVLAAAAAVVVGGPAFAQAPSTALPKLNLPASPSSSAGGAASSGGGATSATGGGSAPAAVQAPWAKVCSLDPKTQKNDCAVSVQIPDNTGKQLLVSATVQTVQDDPKMFFVITVPPGMLLQPGVQVAIDSAKPMPLAYRVCVPNACFAQMDFTADNLKAMRSGKQLTVAAIDQSGQQVSLPISLTGFAKVYDGPATAPNSPAPG